MGNKFQIHLASFALNSHFFFQICYVIAQCCWPGPCGELTPGRAVSATLLTAAVVIAYAAATCFALSTHKQDGS